MSAEATADVRAGAHPEHAAASDERSARISIRTLSALLARAYSRVTTYRYVLYGAAVLRIGYGGLWTLFLLHEFGERDAAWGPNSTWTPALDRSYESLTGVHGLFLSWFTYVAGLGSTEFTLFYLLTIVIGVAFTVGWHTRATAFLWAFTLIALENRAPLITDGGDNVLTLMAVYLLFACCGDRWSLDARRRARHAVRDKQRGTSAPRPQSPALRELAAARRQIVTLMHNGAMLVVAAQICVVYGTAGLLKVQGSMWQNGSALPDVLRLTWFQPWPGLSAFLAGHALLAAVAGYATVLVQVGFPFMVFSRRLKYPALVVLVLMHLFIAVLLGLPFFSAIMVTGDAVFLSDRVWARAGQLIAGPAYAQSMDTMPQQAAAGTASDTRPVLVFDGDCGFCTASVEWGRRHLAPAATFTPWQWLDLDAVGLTEDEVNKSVQWLPESDAAPIRSGAAAVARLLLRSRWPWRPLGVLMLIPPISWAASGVYKLISANRYRLPGATPACAVPRAAQHRD